MRRETKDGKYYMYGEYSDGIPKVRYSIGRCTEQGDQHIEDVLGYREARAFLKDLILKTELSKCKTCDEQIDRAEHECDYCEDCCHELQMSWQTNDVS